MTSKNLNYIRLIVICLLLSACATSRAIIPLEDPNLMYEKASNLQKTGSPQKAYEVYLNLWQAYPKHELADDALFQAARIINTSNPKRATELYARFLDMYPNSPLAVEIKENLFLDYLNLKRFDEAARLFISIYPTEKDVKWLNLGLNIIDPLMAEGAYDASLQVIAVIYADVQPEMAGRLLEAWQTASDNLNDNETLSLIKRDVLEPELASILTRRQEVIAAGSKAAANKLEQPLGQNAIGILLPLSGKWESAGSKILKGIELASGVFSENQATNINYIVKDYASDTDLIPQLIAELDRENVLAIIGPVGSKESAIADRECSERGIPSLNFTRADLEPRQNSYTFNNLSSVTNEAKTLLQVADSMQIRRFAILYPADNFGQSFSSVFEELAPAYGCEIIRKQSYAPTNVDFKEQIQNLSASFTSATDEEGKEILIPDFDALLIPDTARKGAMIASYLEYSGIEGIKLFGPSLWDNPDLLRIGERHVDGATFVSGFFVSSQLDFVQEYVDSFYYTFGYNPSIWEASAFDSATILQNLLSGEVHTRNSLRDRLASMEEYPGVTGSTTFLPDGQVNKTIFVLTVRGSRVMETTSGN